MPWRAYDVASACPAQPVASQASVAVHADAYEAGFSAEEMVEMFGERQGELIELAPGKGIFGESCGESGDEQDNCNVNGNRWDGALSDDFDFENCLF